MADVQDEKAHIVEVSGGAHGWVHHCTTCGYRGPDAPPLPCPGPRDEKGGIALARCRATCNICGVVKNQIDSTRERAEQVVREAMERHVAEAHPEVSNG